MPPSETSIGLTDFIYQIKRELLSPESQTKDPLPVFAVDEIELEIAVVATREGQAGVNIQILNLSGGRTREDAHTVRVKLKPLQSREELIAELRERNPDLVGKIGPYSLPLLKGEQSADQLISDQPMSWP